MPTDRLAQWETSLVGDRVRTSTGRIGTVMSVYVAFNGRYVANVKDDDNHVSSVGPCWLGSLVRVTGGT